MHRTAKLLVAFFGAIVLLVGGVAAYAAIPDSTGTFTACINKTSGAVRIIDTAKTTKCSSNETKTSWNQAGQPGEDGTDGENGFSGREVVFSHIRGTSPGNFAHCPEGKVVLGGGGEVQLFTNGVPTSWGAVISRSEPNINEQLGEQGWAVAVAKNDGTALDVDEEFSIDAYAICVDEPDAQ